MCIFGELISSLLGKIVGIMKNGLCMDMASRTQVWRAVRYESKGRVSGNDQYNR